MEKWYDTGHFLQGLQLDFTYFTHKKTSEINSEVSEASTGIEPVIEVLQTFALPLGYDAIFLVTPTGIEPVLPPWKGDVLTAWPRSLIFKKTPRVGLEPTTPRLTAVCSTIELSRNTEVIIPSKLHTVKY